MENNLKENNYVESNYFTEFYQDEQKIRFKKEILVKLYHTEDMMRDTI